MHLMQDANQKKLFRSVVTYRLCLYVCLQATIGRRKMKLLSSCRFLICGSIIYSQTNLMMYTCGCNVLTADSPSERVTIVSAYRPIHCGKLFFITIYFWLGILLSVSQTNAM